jgi:hypothetical protein
MRIRIILLLMISITVSSIGYPADQTIGQVIEGAVWEWHPDSLEKSPYFVFKFNKGNLELAGQASFSFGEDLSNFYGTYTIIDDRNVKIEYCLYSAYDLGLEQPDELKRERPKTLTTKISLIRLDSSPYYDYVLKCDNGVFIASTDRTVKAGLTRYIDATEVLTMGAAAAVAADNATIRRSPSANGEELTFCDGMNAAPLKYYPKGYKLCVLARTVKKERVKNRSNYWYYVLLEQAETDFTPSRFAWVFGESIRIGKPEISSH